MDKNNHPSPILAVFDFDGTLTYKDTLIPFLLFARPLNVVLRAMIWLVPTILAYFLKKKTRQQVKETLLKCCFSTHSFEELSAKGKEFSKEHIDNFLKPEGLERLSWHQEQGHCCILLSANLDLFLEPWGKQMGFNHIITSKCAVTDDGKLTGYLKGINCWGPEKVRRLLEVIGERNNFVIYAYGDSLGDKELLELADHSFYRCWKVSNAKI